MTSMLTAMLASAMVALSTFGLIETLKEVRNQELKFQVVRLFDHFLINKLDKIDEDSNVELRKEIEIRMICFSMLMLIGLIQVIKYQFNNILKLLK